MDKCLNLKKYIIEKNNNFKQHLVANKTKLKNLFLTFILFLIIILNSGYTLTFLNNEETA